MKSRCLNLYVPLTHETDFTSSNYSSAISRIQDVWVIRKPLGDVTITTPNNGANVLNNVYSTYTLTPSAFIEGEIYNINIKSVSYANSGDISSPPILGII